VLLNQLCRLDALLAADITPLRTQNLSLIADMLYPSIPSSTAPLPHGEDLSNPIPPVVSLSEGESVSLTARDEVR